MSEIVFFDLDDTLIFGQSQIMLVKYLFSRHKLNFLALIITIIWMLLYKAGIIKDVLPAMEKSYKIATGWGVEDAKILVRDFIKVEVKNKIYLRALKIIQEHKKQNRKIAVISNSPQLIVDEISSFIKADYAFGTKLEIKNYIYTGRIDGKPLYGKQKAEFIMAIAVKEDWDLKNSFAYSDHYSDVFMMELVGNPVAVNPDKKLRLIAKEKKWVIENFKI
ncbi:MAG: HAD family hydrolase [Candidatus Buchananbacteria bacterium]